MIEKVAFMRLFLYCKFNPKLKMNIFLKMSITFVTQLRIGLPIIYCKKKNGTR